MAVGDQITVAVSAMMYSREERMDGSPVKIAAS
jgi:hypothetical protein